MRLNAHGFSIDLPRGWEGTISRRPDTAAARAGRAPSGATPLAEEQVLPAAHLATFGVPADRGDFGSGAGHQSWYTINGRALGLYVVLGSHGLARRLVPRVNEVLAAVQVEA